MQTNQYMNRSVLGWVSGLLLTLIATDASAQEPIRIGVIADMSGAYATLAGPGTVVGVNLAVQEFGGKVLGRPIEVLSADSLQKTDIAATKAREWYDRQNVQMMIEASDSATAVALQKLAAEKKRITFFMSGSTVLTNRECTNYGIHWAWDTYSMANGVATAVTSSGGDSWYFITTDYVFGKSLEADTIKAVQKAGGKVVGQSKHPLNAVDFASQLITAQQSGAKVVAFANAGSDAQNAVKQAAEFGLTKQQMVVPLMLFDTDVKGIGLQQTQGLRFTTGFYWDFDDNTRAFAKRFYDIHKAMPSMDHAGAYSAALQYLKAVQAVNTIDPDAVMEQLRKTPISDAFARNGRVREDGRMVHDMYQVEVKTPAESRGSWDLLYVRRTIPGDEAYMPLSESSCPLVKK